MRDIEQELIEYKTYLLLEKKLSANSIEAYIRDISGLKEYYEGNIFSIKMEEIESYLLHLYESGVNRTSQARILSGIKSFYNYLYVYDKIDMLPTDLIDSPKVVRKIPSYLTSEEVHKMLDSIDLSEPLAHRNRAILELLYSSGLRVSELIELKLSDLFFESGYLRVVGKGDKERLVPVGAAAIKAVNLYREERRVSVIDAKHQNYLFLNRRGKRISRVMVFNIVKEVASSAGIEKKVSPHTFRHTFASLLIKGGADIRALQQMLGHESIVTTEIYTHIDTSQKRKNIEKLFGSDTKQ
ncbi:MAG: site-specific tyrosine recombinase/integron integrase [Rikenellaceae bacterium]